MADASTASGLARWAIEVTVVDLSVPSELTLLKYKLLDRVRSVKPYFTLIQTDLSADVSKLQGDSHLNSSPERAK